MRIEIAIWSVTDIEIRKELFTILKETSENEGTRVRLRALLVALVGVSLAACALASQPEEVELEPSEVARLLSDGNTVKRILKPTVRVVVGCSRLNACVTAVTSLMLLIAVMCSESRPSRGTRWLSAPALLLTAYQASADTADALLAAALRVPGAPASAVGHIVGAALLVSIDIVVCGGARRRRRRQPPTASRLKGPRKQKRFAYKLLKRDLAKSFAYKLLKRGLANLMSPTSTSGIAPPLISVALMTVGPPTADGSRSGAPDNGAHYDTA
ncbi:hypothetical protein EVAR_94034_1 [Eumeta japonica]|uniref:Uncharacterized protein n=1 Tax=Eumeta variegata TaxID=151549 RepID=A0A4C1V5B8_EUMVA|nr:hypothetical protein EVAR_94034_1 [Eumeta japonica]